MEAQVVKPEDVILIPVEVPVATGAMIVTTLLAMMVTGTLVWFAAYDVGKTDGYIEQGRQNEKTVQAMEKRLEALRQELVAAKRDNGRPDREAVT
jgi:hypothetical protein